jgi:transglutaminase-like putative cysteine protease
MTTEALEIFMKLKLGCELSYDVIEETMFIFNLEAAPLGAHTGLAGRIQCTPDLERRSYTVPGLLTRYIGVLAPPGAFSIRYDAELELAVLRADPTTINETPVRDVPLEILPYLLPSRFVPSDRLAAFARREFGEIPKGHARITQVCNWIHDNIEYQRGSSDAETIATEILIQRAGVCRDFAHLGIAFCRALDVPARYVTCYAYGLEPADFHAVFEAYLDGRWWLFDPTRQAALDGLVRIGVGRDAAEVAFSTQFGKMEPGPMRVWIERADGGSPEGSRTTDAISTDDPVSAA